jgi:hypothetical protein
MASGLLAASGEFSHIQCWLSQISRREVNITDGRNSYLVVRLEHVDDDGAQSYVEAVTALLRVVLLRASLPADIITRLSLTHPYVVNKATKLRKMLPVYLTKWRALLDAHCPLIAPLQALVAGYAEFTIDDVWAIEVLGVRRGKKRFHAD